MPTTTKDVVAAANRVKATVTIPVDKVVLSTLNLVDLSNALQPNDAYAEIGLMSGGTEVGQKIAVVASGYIGKAITVSWTGKIICEPDMFLYGDVYSSVGGTFRLQGLVTPYKTGEKGELILDP